VRWPALGLALAVLAGGCAPAAREAPPPPPPKAEAPPSDLVVLVPGQDGKVGSIVVTHGPQQRTLDSAYAAARIGRDGQLDTALITTEEVRQIFGEALAARPPRPVTFILYFQGASDNLTPESRRELDRILPEIAGRPAPDVVVVGHTDRVGSVAYNDALSLRRAERISGELMKLGIPRDRIAVAGRGEREPLVPTADQVEEPKNRRVEVTVR